MKHKLLAVIFLVGGVSAVGEDLKEGNWIMEVYHPSEPLELIHVVAEASGDHFTLVDIDGETLFEDVRVEDGDIEFQHPTLEESCRLVGNKKKAGWQGTCPPGNALEFSEGLTISLRPPKTGTASEDEDGEQAGEDESSE